MHCINFNNIITNLIKCIARYIKFEISLTKQPEMSEMSKQPGGQV